ncbi:hypothetical protein ABBQ32_008568 [Trebouxia sp. C0010 RCD-2024]
MAPVAQHPSMLRSASTPMSQRPFACRRSYLPRRDTATCHSTHTHLGNMRSNSKETQTTHNHEAFSASAPRSPFNTGSMDITTAGATASLCGHSIPAEKTVIVLRHGMTTWNEEQRIQVSSYACFKA